MVMVLSPWHDPETLKRTWCVYEVYLSIVLNARFEIAMGKSQKVAFLDDIQNSNNIERMRSLVNCKNSITTVPTDRDHIFKLIEDAVGGTDALDRIVFDVMLKWVLRTLDQQLDLSGSPEDRFRWMCFKAGAILQLGSYDQAMQVNEAAIALFRTELPTSFWQGWEVVCVYVEQRARMQHPSEVWEPMLDEAISMLQELLGPDHEVALGAMRTGGASFTAIRRYDRAKALLDECHEQEQSKPDDFHEKYTTMQDLGNCVKQGQYVEAEENLTAIVDEAYRSLGPIHRETLRRQGNLAAIKRLRGNYDEAEDMLRHCIHHLQVLKDDYGVAIYTRHHGLVKWDEGDYTQAKALLEEFTASGMASAGPKSYFGWVGLLNSYMIRLEMGNEFDSIEKIDHFVAQLDAAELGHETWKEVLCHGCYKLVQGDLTMCSQCPRLAVLFCPTCVKSKPNTVCDHLDGPWIVMKPPMRYLLEQKLTLQATQKKNGWQDLYDATVAVYSAYCDQFNVTHCNPVK